MKCPIETQERTELLLAYCSGSLDADRRANLEEHLRDCAECREFVARQKAVWEALDQWEAAPVSADFNRRLYQRIDHEISWWDRLLRPLRPVGLRQGLPVAAMAALVLVAGLLIHPPSNVPVVTHPESAKVEALAPEQVEHALDEMETMREFNLLMHPETANPKM